MNLLQKKLLLAKKKISIKIMFYVCCMQCMQHIFNKQHIKRLNIKIIDQVISVKDVKHLNICRTSAINHQDAYFVNKII